jgi:hypothetical protein
MAAEATGNVTRQRPILWLGLSLYVSLLLSGWINPIFLVALFYVFRGQHHRAVTILSVVILLMIPFCWVVFLYEDFFPREGHFLWIIGMLLVLFSEQFSQLLRAT